MGKKAVVALGGNALIKAGQKGTIYEQFANTRASMKTILEMIKDGWELLITHGNGPQVGAILLQNQCAKTVTPPMPLGICVAESQGLIGYMIQQCLLNALKKENIDKSVIAVITQVVIDGNDPHLTHPSKPIGPYFSKKEAEEMIRDGYQMIEQQRGWRILVPSPEPLRIVEGASIRKIIDDGIIVIASGGGGLAVQEKPNWGLDGVEVVIDKDLTAAKLAEEIQADLLLILTDVEKIYRMYNTPEQTPIDTISLQKIKSYYDNHEFPEGSMGPKVNAAIRFLEKGGKKVIISHIDKGWEALIGETGTHILP
ncbi:MAG: carbamate kinase [Candidatus Thermoplasmatota archaeon]|nr:carbamate kinase [Candidatus Thermoplasmatota archaeon]MBU1941456.1 carbamate kinase [Candidatus Thermoplasmatota archaeon]